MEKKVKMYYICDMKKYDFSKPITDFSGESIKKNTSTAVSFFNAIQKEATEQGKEGSIPVVRIQEILDENVSMTSDLTVCDVVHFCLQQVPPSKDTAFAWYKLGQKIKKETLSLSDIEVNILKNIINKCILESENTPTDTVKLSLLEYGAVMDVLS